MPRNILIFADGTGNEGGLLPDESRTNVYKLYCATRTGSGSTIDPEQQLAFYVPGIGTPTPGHSSWEQRFRETVQQIVGLGVRNKIIDSYVAILGVWRPGDRIYLFGFSRGAYTVRCLAHVLELIGIPTVEDNAQPLDLDPAKLRGLARKTVRILYRFGLPVSNTQRREAQAQKFRDAHQCLTGPAVGAVPYFIGVWDTVAAMGWAHLLPIMYDEHYPKTVKFARHATAIDEYRSDFVRVPWGGSGTVPEGVPGELDPFQQIWFAGESRRHRR